MTIDDKVWLALEDNDHKSEWIVVGTVFDLSNAQRTVFLPPRNVSARSRSGGTQFVGVGVDAAR